MADNPPVNASPAAAPPPPSPPPPFLRVSVAEEKLILRLRKLAKRRGALVLVRLTERLELVVVPGDWEILGACAQAEHVIQS